jgi:hypothetical protein
MVCYFSDDFNKEEGMNCSAAVNHWNALDILDAGNVLFRFGFLILNQPINIQRDFVCSLWNRGKCEFRIAVDTVRNILLVTILNVSQELKLCIITSRSLKVLDLQIFLVFRSVTLPDVYDISDEECYCSSDTNVTKV